MGVDNISAKLLKKAGVAIIDPITHIISLSLQTSVFPGSWKRARLNPIYKSGDYTDLRNYHPIAILPVLSKIKRYVEMGGGLLTRTSCANAW